MLTKRKKILILCTMLVLLVVTGYLNMTLNSSPSIDTSGDNYTAAGFFAGFRAERTTTRSEAMLYYEAIINNSNSSAEAKTLAEQKQSEILDIMKLELAIEGLIKAKGFTDVIASCSDSYINIMVQSAELQESEVAQIVEIVQSQTNKDIDFIKIMPVE